MAVIEVKNLSKNYEQEHALAGIDFTVSPGELFGIIGADGAGKTTLMKIMVTLLKQDNGTCTLLSFDTSKQRMNIRSAIGYMPQKFSLYEDLSVRENMFFFADIFGVGGSERKSRIERLLTFSALGPFQNRRARYLSGGMKQKLALSCALIHTPQVLILDEPTTGVDPVSRREFWAILSELKQQGITIVVSTPYMDEAEYCDNLILMHKGKILRTGTPRQLVKEYPHHLYQVSAQTGSLHYASQGPKPASVLSIYGVGSDLHVASTIEPDSSNRLLTEIQRYFPNASAIASIQPEIEDMFLYYLSNIESNASLPVKG